ncbi:helix-turn-helix transcriptional regulator [Agreia sp. VKM Ac-1783]|uniref:helix-turn-helix domain-containing protein n=1 Tax=Agreia sp. VKM Ac-1783 TaxID=1938889 RepID=UPI000A3C5279|nr:helix-turn-helix transcriptional regulator [Agreia sp. VKM Ac-1783]
MTITESRTTIHGRLRAARLMAGLEQGDLADALGVSRGSVSNYETGKSEPVASVFVNWARLTEVSLDWLAGGLNKKAPDSVESGADGVVRPKGFEPLAF